MLLRKHLTFHLDFVGIANNAKPPHSPEKCSNGNVTDVHDVRPFMLRFIVITRKARTTNVQIIIQSYRREKLHAAVRIPVINLYRSVVQ